MFRQLYTGNTFNKHWISIALIVSNEWNIRGMIWNPQSVLNTANWSFLIIMVSLSMLKWLSNDQTPDIRWQSDSGTFRFHVLPRDFKYIHKFSCLDLRITRHAFACQTDCVLQQWSHVCQTHRLPCVTWFITFYSSSEINIGPCNVAGHVMGGHFWRA